MSRELSVVKCGAIDCKYSRLGKFHSTLGANRIYLLILVLVRGGQLNRKFSRVRLRIVSLEIGSTVSRHTSALFLSIRVHAHVCVFVCVGPRPLRSAVSISTVSSHWVSLEFTRSHSCVSITSATESPPKLGSVIFF